MTMNRTTRFFTGVPLNVIVALLLCCAAALLGSIIAYAVLDISLGTVFAAVFVSVLVMIAITPIVTNWMGLLVVSFVIALASTMPVLLGFYDQPTLINPGLQLLAVCIAMNLLIAGLLRLLIKCLGNASASAVLLVMVLAYLVWPVWLSPWFGTRGGAWMLNHAITAQPMIALNGAYEALGDWSHAPIAYKYLTNLGQDYLYAMPASAFWAIIWHASLGILLIGVSALIDVIIKRKRPIK